MRGGRQRIEKPKTQAEKKIKDHEKINRSMYVISALVAGHINITINNNNNVDSYI